MTRKRPEDCRDIQEIRSEIDRLDRQLLSALGERARYVTGVEGVPLTVTIADRVLTTGSPR